jgi:hypothetical protein
MRRSLAVSSDDPAGPRPEQGESAIDPEVSRLGVGATAGVG